MGTLLLRLFRQEKPGNWEPVIRRVTRYLSSLSLGAPKVMFDSPVYL